MDTGKNPLSELTAAEQAFVEEHLSDDVSRLALSLAHNADLRSQLVLRQIEGLQTLQRKIPSLAAVKGLMLPPRTVTSSASRPAAKNPTAAASTRHTSAFSAPCPRRLRPLAKRFASL